MMKSAKNPKTPGGSDAGRQRDLPVARAEDVEFCRELADEDDLEAMERAAKADMRQTKGESQA
jgi:hypothetical protein